jgi:alcohol dehydrogenase class IV
VSSAFLVIDPGALQAGVADRALASLEAAKIAYSTFTKVKPDPLDVDMEEGASEFACEPREAVVGIGGGSAMDTAKTIALIATNGGRIRDYNGTDRVPKDLMPLVCIPTTAGTGSEVTANIAVANADTHEKMSVRSPRNYPRFALLDPELLAGLPQAVAAASGLDALVHAIESYVSVRSTPLTRLLAFEAVRRIGKAIEEFVVDPGQLEAGAQMLFGSMLAGMAISHTGTGAAHAVARAIGGKYEVAHGLACGVLLEPVMRFNLSVAAERFAELADALGARVADRSNDSLAEATIARVAEIRESAGLPRRLPIEVPESALAELAEWAAKSSGPNPRKTTRTDAQRLLKQVVTTTSG